MDLSLEAIENDLNRAEVALGRPEAVIHSQRALIRATLRAQQPATSTSTEHIDGATGGVTVVSNDIQIVNADHWSTYVVPNGASSRDRIEAAARIMGLTFEEFDRQLRQFGVDVSDFGAEPEEDVFADAKKAHRKK